MWVRLVTPIHSHTRNTSFFPLLHKPYFLPQTLKMVTPTQAISKRPTCPSCSKPVKLCLCNRIQNPGLHNSVSVTILQHSFEKKHPLNSARIARIGLKNLSVVTVFDVHFEARFVIRLLDPDSKTGLDQIGSKVESFDETRETQMVDSGFCKVGNEGFESSLEQGSVIDCDEQCDLGAVSSPQIQLGSVDSVDNCSVSNSDGLLVDREDDSSDAKGVFDLEDCTSTMEPVITAMISKNGVSKVTHTWMPHHKNLQFNAISDITEAREALAKGFVVRKLQKPQPKGNVGLEEEEEEEAVEFEVEIPAGSVLLFPSKEAVSASDLEAMDIKVKNLIVLDGTWSKAKRMYEENPWLKLLPHLRLDLDKLSMYSEVRIQPKPGFLSTIESIVYALKAVGDSPEGLENLLDVFESMVGDQRRCKEERLGNVSLPGHRTRTHTDGGKTPIFQEKFVIPLVEGLKEMNVKVWNSNSVTFDDFIGEGKVQLQKVLSQGYDDGTWPIQTKTGRYSGQVRLIMHYSTPNKPAIGKYAPSAPPAPAHMYSTPPPAAAYPSNPAQGGYPPSPFSAPPPAATYPPSPSLFYAPPQGSYGMYPPPPY